MEVDAAEKCTISHHGRSILNSYTNHKTERLQEIQQYVQHYTFGENKNFWSGYTEVSVQHTPFLRNKSSLGQPASRFLTREGRYLYSNVHVRKSTICHAVRVTLVSYRALFPVLSSLVLSVSPLTLVLCLLR